jgi:hypothetical protein
MNHLTLLGSPQRIEPSNAWRGVEGSGEQSEANPTPSNDIDAMGPCRLLRHFQERLSQLGFGLYPLTGDVLLLTNPKLGMSRTVPDLRAARIFLMQLEGATHG